MTMMPPSATRVAMLAAVMVIRFFEATRPLRRLVIRDSRPPYLGIASLYFSLS
jgi:hypothetical protein